jgi:hypothetical protein
MDTNTVREAVLKRPFRPFYLRMNDGREFYIPHPEYVAVSRRVVLAINSVTDAGVYLEPVLIASLHYEDERPKPAAGPNNGGQS